VLAALGLVMGWTLLAEMLHVPWVLGLWPAPQPCLLRLNCQSRSANSPS
jgi:hypothetical protein